MRFVKASIVTASLLFSAFCLVCIISVRASPVQPVGADAAATRNGDTNGDGSLDISDAIYLLVHLFRNGPPPVALADSPEIVARLDDLEVRTSNLEQMASLVAEHQEILSHITVEQLDDGTGGTAKTIRLSGVNLQVVNGLGATNGNPDAPHSRDPGDTFTDGTGNLIVGYVESRAADNGVDVRTGSHNIVVGGYHNYTSFGGLIAGLSNDVSAAYVTVGGGFNKVSSDMSPSSSSCNRSDDRPTCNPVLPRLKGLAYDSQDGILYGISDQRVLLFSNILLRGATHEGPELDSLLSGLAFDPEEDTFYSTRYVVIDGRPYTQIVSLDVETGTATRIGESLRYEVKDLTFDSANRTLYALEPGNFSIGLPDALIHIDPRTGRKADDYRMTAGISPIVSTGIAFDPVNSELYAILVVFPQRDRRELYSLSPTGRLSSASIRGLPLHSALLEINPTTQKLLTLEDGPEEWRLLETPAP